MLLDEPDAHLHPSMTQQFMDVVQQVLVERYKVRVVMTTHSPSTVALAPEGSIFQMERSNPVITRVASKSDAVGLLTAGLVTVSATTKYALVEDTDDVNFYGVVRDILMDRGPSKDDMALALSPSVVFMSASAGSGHTKISGGKGAVSKWVRKLNDPPFDQVIRGIIDQDSGNVAEPRIFVLNRYSIENYLLDPFVVFCLLSESNRAPISLFSSGSEHLIRTLDNTQLQSIMVAIRSSVEPQMPNLKPAELVELPTPFTNGREAKYPLWMLSRRGHDLLPIYQKVFGGGANFVSPPRLMSAMKRGRLLPKDLATLLHQVQR